MIGVEIEDPVTVIFQSLAGGVGEEAEFVGAVRIEAQMTSPY